MPVSEIGLGCWQLGGDFGPISESKACHIIEAALENGVTFFDTADVYGAGQSETYLGKMLSSAPAEIKVATKYGRGPNTYPTGYSLQDLRDSVRYAQDRLQKDSLDLLQLHCIPPAVLKNGEIFEWLNVIKQEGMISNYGASVETIEEAFLCLEDSGLTSLQIIFNLFRQRPKAELFQKALENNVGIIVRLPLASGVLSGKYKANHHFDATDHRNYNKNGDAFSVGETFSGIAFEQALEQVEKIKALIPGSLPMAEFAQRWILDHSAVSSIITGASSVEQVKSNVSASAVEPLSEELHARLYELYVNDIEPLIRCEI